jgi:hypothetical protein
VADAFEQELLTNIAEAEFIGQDDLAAEWRLELNNYRAAMKQTILEEQALGGSSADAGRDALGRPRSDQPWDDVALRHYAPRAGRLPQPNFVLKSWYIRFNSMLGRATGGNLELAGQRGMKRRADRGPPASRADAKMINRLPLVR